MKRYKVAVLGASGFAGAELLRRLLRHPEIEVARVVAPDHVGKKVAVAHPHLEGLTDLRFENLPPEEAAAGVDVVVMGLPFDASLALVQALRDSEVRILDLSGAFRLRDPALYERWYGTPHPLPHLLERFVYGLPELERSRIRGARFVASPGCFATTLALSLLPFARAGLLEGPLEAVGVTASSGAGVVPTATTHHPTRAGNLRTYRPLQHQHAPEVLETLARAGGRGLDLGFVPVSAPLVRGIFSSTTFRVPAEVGQDDLRNAVRTFTAEQRLVRCPEERLPEVIAVSGSCFAEIGFALGEGSGADRRVVAFGALDNLIKGGAGQAIQNLNLMLGLDETLTLEDPGPYP